MNDEQLLRVAIVSNPAEDDPRLRYADLLRERDHVEHAEFIEQSVRSPEDHVHHFPPGHQAFVMLDRRDGSPEPVPVWCAEAFDGVAFTVRRGFADGVTCTAANWIGFGDALTCDYPITSVALTAWPAFQRPHYHGDGRYHLTLGGFNDGNAPSGIGRTVQEAIISALNVRWPDISFTMD